MKLSELKKHQEATVVRVDASGELKQRLASFGLLRGANIKIIDCSLGKSTIEVMVDNTLLALRKEEAEKIEVETIDDQAYHGKQKRVRQRERRRLVQEIKK